MLLNLTAQQWKNKVSEEIGDAAQDHVFELRLPLATSDGTWIGVFNGSQSDPIAYNSPAGAVKSALEATDTIGDNNVDVDGIRKGPYLVTMTGELAGMDVSALFSTIADLTPDSAVTVTTVQTGKSAKYTTDINALWDSLVADETPLQICYLICKIEVGKKRLGSLQSSVDTEDRDYKEKRSQAVAELRRIIADAQRDLAALYLQIDSAGSNATLTGKIDRRPFLDGYGERGGACCPPPNEFAARRHPRR